MMFETVDRQALIVNLYSTKNTRKLQHFGHVHYVSRRLKYAIVYVNSATIEAAKTQISHLDFVKSVSISPKKEINFNFEESLDPDDNTFVTSLTGSHQERSLDDIVASFKTKNR